MNKRLKIFRYIMIMLMLILFLRAGYLQLVQGEYYRKLSEGNRTSYRPINAPRGKIYSYFEEEEENPREYLMAANKMAYSIYILPQEVPEQLEVTGLINRLVEICDLEFDNEPESPRESLYYNYRVNRKRNIEAMGSVFTSFPVLIKRNISPENMLLIKENQERLPGLTVEDYPARDYNYNDLAAHVLGYVGEVNKEELRNDEGQNYRVGDYTGKTGLEATYETYLRGTGGMEQIEINNRGEKIQTLGTRPPESGYDLVLNIDLELQKKTEKLLEDHIELLREQRQKEEQEDDESGSFLTGAAVILMEPDTGALKALTSYPSFDLNLFARGISAGNYEELISNPRRPFLNRTTTPYPAGSVFKLVTGTAAIEELGVRGETKFVDENGLFYIPGWSRPFKNWHPVGEGEIDFTRAIARSNNIVFYELGYELYQNFGGEKLIEYSRRYGFGELTGVDLPYESRGQIPDHRWKMQTRGEGWYPGDSVNLAIGQGGLLVTPLQLLNMVSVVANRGKIYRPRLVNRVLDQDGSILEQWEPEVITELDVGEEAFEILEEGMIDTTEKDYGTGSGYFSDLSYKVAGKTGTAQTAVEGENHGWFVGYAPASDPEVAFVVFLENGASSANTLPLVGDILTEYFSEAETINEEKSITENHREYNIESPIGTNLSREGPPALLADILRDMDSKFSAE